MDEIRDALKSRRYTYPSRYFDDPIADTYGLMKGILSYFNNLPAYSMKSDVKIFFQDAFRAVYTMLGEHEYRQWMHRLKEFQSRWVMPRFSK